MVIFEYQNYKDYVRAWVQNRPNQGRGEYRRMALGLRVSTTLISQVVNGDKHFSMELGDELCQMLGLGESEAEYFLLLLEHGRAGTESYRARLKTRILTRSQAALKLVNRVQQDRELTDFEAAVYYSHWTYTGVVQLIACDPNWTAESLAERLKMPRQLLAKVLEFLLTSGIVVNRDGGLQISTKHTFLKADSPLVVKHHQNWRLRAFDKMPFSNSRDLFYTGAMSLSEETALLVRQELTATIERVLKSVGPSPSEVVRTLNIDWFEF